MTIGFFYKKYLEKQTAIFPFINFALPMIKFFIKLKKKKPQL